MASRTHADRIGAGWLVAPLLVALGACGGSAASDSAVPDASVPDVAEISLPPASDAATPEPVASVEPLPSLGPPSGAPTAPEQPSPDYGAGADDLAAFDEAYRAAFAAADLTDDQVDAAGARLCGYVQRHADADGVVDAEGALTEADVNEPGYARADWVTAFEIALLHYCGEFSAEFGGLGG